jgi:glucose dehydrogenase
MLRQKFIVWTERLLSPKEYLCEEPGKGPHDSELDKGTTLLVYAGTLRDNTVRPETLNVGSNALAGTWAWMIQKRTGQMLIQWKGWRNPMVDIRCNLGGEIN